MGIVPRAEVDASRLTEGGGERYAGVGYLHAGAGLGYRAGRGVQLCSFSLRGRASRRARSEPGSEL